ncbi:hypothetical protein HYH03_011081 [Edaphochlamys debaryana]|uniref:Uncharacterized protein n=1 Tax=Edaphochlamys debaryana TaxID=47281 RepID=A0A835Y0R6_9CHLO|nr:hypothetical protein HYH03_011081 [Edaphochlamys debaryana]|eukprot:KAG2490445.1 hypothetical protein HYH03_011081 [Edaphochlamys debaryana]
MAKRRQSVRIMQSQHKQPVRIPRTQHTVKTRPRSKWTEEEEEDVEEDVEEDDEEDEEEETEELCRRVRAVLGKRKACMDQKDEEIAHLREQLKQAKLQQAKLQLALDQVNQ